jgi:hypothetical protein
MLQVKEFKIANLLKPLADIDITHLNSWVGVTDFSDNEQSVYFGNNQVRLPEKVNFPIVRAIDDQTVLVANSRAWTQNNAWIISATGEVKSNFSAGDAIENIVIAKDFIVVGYFDEAACYGEGLTVFDFQGNELFGYKEAFGKEAVSIYDCYASALVEENQVVFCPYTEFPLVFFDIESKTQEVWETPVAVHGFSAITKFADKIYFHRTYNPEIDGYDFGVYEWQIGSKEARKIGECQSHFTRGLPNGRFLARTDSGYTIISLQ